MSNALKGIGGEVIVKKFSNKFFELASTCILASNLFMVPCSRKLLIVVKLVSSELHYRILRTHTLPLIMYLTIIGNYSSPEESYLKGTRTLSFGNQAKEMCGHFG